MKRNRQWVKKVAWLLMGSMLAMYTPVWGQENAEDVLNEVMQTAEVASEVSQEKETVQNDADTDGTQTKSEENSSGQPSDSNQTETPDQPSDSKPTEAPDQPSDPEPTKTPDQPSDPKPTETPDQPSDPKPTQTPVPFNPVEKGALLISRSKMKKGIKENSDFAVQIILKNTWKESTLKNVKLTPELPSGISMDVSYLKQTIDVSDINPGSVRKVKIKLHADKIDTSMSVLQIPVRVSFQKKDSAETTEQRETLLIPVDSGQNNKKFVDNTADYSGDAGGDYGGGSSDSGSEAKKIDPMVPRVIVTQYDYDKTAAVGQEFTANITVLNTNDKLNAENMVVTFDTGETATVEGGSNTAYIQTLEPKKSYTAQVNLKVPEDSKTGNADVNVSFKYEYMKNSERTEVETSSKISIPVQSVDRFSAGDAQTSDEISQGEEFTVSLPYVNKGNTAIRNLEAYIETDMKTTETYKYIGNVEAGTSGTADFFVTPEKAGESEVKITLNYEDSAGNQKTIEKEGSFQAQEAIQEDAAMGDMESMDGEYGEAEGTDMPGDTGSNNKKEVAVAGAGGAVLAGALVFALKKKKRKSSIDDEEL